MLGFFFSFQGRLSRRQYWLRLWLVSVVIAPVLVATLLLSPHIRWWVVATIFAATVLPAGASAAAMSVRRAHDLGKPGRSILRPFSFVAWRLLFSEGEAHDNQYGSAHSGFGQGWRIGRLVAGLGLLSVVVLGVVFYRVFAGPSWKWPDCKPAVTAEGTSIDAARERWRQAVESIHGPAYAELKMTIMQSTTCHDAVCKTSARPCLQVQ